MQFNVTTIVYGVLPIVQAVNTVCLCVNEILLLSTSINALFADYCQTAIVRLKQPMLAEIAKLLCLKL